MESVTAKNSCSGSFRKEAYEWDIEESNIDWLSLWKSDSAAWTECDLDANIARMGDGGDRPYKDVREDEETQTNTVEADRDAIICPTLNVAYCRESGKVSGRATAELSGNAISGSKDKCQGIIVAVLEGATTIRHSVLLGCSSLGLQEMEVSSEYVKDWQDSQQEADYGPLAGLNYAREVEAVTGSTSLDHLSLGELLLIPIAWLLYSHFWREPKVAHLAHPYLYLIRGEDLHEVHIVKADTMVIPTIGRSWAQPRGRKGCSWKHQELILQRDWKRWSPEIGGGHHVITGLTFGGANQIKGFIRKDK
ncbi:hypothetical protein VNO78_09448 [Psophocarpus tetragonolobus]|uniref:Uncharacterized protein n=1 Tax=Psophocarpus tetragonolobus TaxID=3891 RepID=A0AAN9SZ89_PSOTE